MATEGDHQDKQGARAKAAFAWAILLGGAALAMALIYVAFEFDWIGLLSAKSIKSWIKELGYWGVFASVGLMVAHSFLPFPAEVIAIANGMVYGPVWGTVITWSGAMLGAIVAFATARKFGRPFVVKMLRKYDMRRLDALAESYGPITIFLARFVPLIAFNLVNIAAGLIRMPWWIFIATTGIGILPFTVIMVWLGHGLDSMDWKLLLGLVAGGVILWLLFHRIFRSGRLTPQVDAGPTADEIQSVTCVAVRSESK